MPLSGGTSGAHDDSMHQGNAKRDVVDGLAGLGPLGELLAPGSDLELVRDGSDHIELIERTSGEIVARWTRVGVNDYTQWLHVGAVPTEILNDAMKDVANGIAGLDASVEIPLALLKVDVANGIAGLDASVKLSYAQLPFPMLDETMFRANAAIGTATNPSRLNDNNLVNPCWFSNIGEYGEVQLDEGMFVNEVRQYGEDANEENGSFKIQFLGNALWIDVSAPFSTIKGGWGTWISLSRPVYTTALRVVAVTIDTHYGLNRNDVVELQARG